MGKGKVEQTEYIMDYPIVLAHGISRFDLWNPNSGIDDNADDGHHYFKGILSALKQAGHVAYHSTVSWASPISRRAAELKANVESVLMKTGAHRVHIIAHSMGGLDARHMLFDNKMENAVASLSTIGTPHCGTTFADFGVKNAAALIPFTKGFGLNIDGFEDLTTAACRAFNEKAKRFEQSLISSKKVMFQTFAGCQRPLYVFDLLKPSWIIIDHHEGANDGLVSVHSAAWDYDLYQGAWDADHLNECGWWDEAEAWRPPADPWEESSIRSKYVAIANKLRGMDG